MISYLHITILVHDNPYLFECYSCNAKLIIVTMNGYRKVDGWLVINLVFMEVGWYLPVHGSPEC